MAIEIIGIFFSHFGSLIEYNIASRNHFWRIDHLIKSKSLEIKTTHTQIILYL